MAFGKKKPEVPVEAPMDGNRAARRPIFRSAVVIRADGGTIDVIARNVSKTGCRIDCAGAENLPKKLQIRLDVNGSPKNARLVWADNSEAGLEFF